MTNLAEDLEIWFKERPLWLQDAARRLLDKGELDETDYSDLLKICSKEAGVEFKSEEFVDGQCIPVEAFAQTEHTHKVELCSISNVIGINALNPRNPLEIKDGLTVIYGQNGSGKSGYTRLLKQVCGAKKAGDLHHNVYEAKAVSQSCKIKYKYDGNDCELNWNTSQGINEQLSTIELYDSECGSVYVVDENQLAYEPALLRLFTKLTTASDNLSSRLDSLSKESPSTKPLLPANYTTTKSGQWYTSINFKTSDSEINQECAWSDYNQKSLDALNVRLKSPDPKANAIAIRKTKLQVDKLVADFCNWQPKLSDEACSAYLASKKDCSVKQLAASEYAKSIFQNSPLTGIGEEAWNLLWEQARAYSQNVAYPQLEFPNVENEAVCVLCQQPFDNETKKRFSDFEGFVKGELELAAKKAKKVLDEIEKSLTKTPEEELINSFIVAAGLDDAMSQKVRTLREEIAQKSKELLDTEIDKEYTAKLDFTVTDELIALSESKEETAKQLDKDAEKDQRDAIQKEALELEAKKWISEQKQEILTEVCLLNKKAKITHAKKSVNTSALTIKKSSLAELLVTAEYICRFEKEIEKLGAGRIKVFLEKTRSAKGEVYFQIKLKNNLLPLSVDTVLSEGEFRIISLAAFLADVEGHVDKSTFIFDDPISSLDQDYEEKVVKRLVELSTTRQVIVFTHRLSLMALLDASNTIGLSKEPWGTGEPSSLLPIHTQNTKKAINTLIDKIPEGRKKFNDEGTEPYSWWVKGVCSHTRITIEKVIEFDLLADVVQRFRRPITTQGKLHKVAKVTLEDCKYIDKLMTKYSRYEHSQPSEAPVQSPEPSELEADLTKLKKWLEEFTRR